MNPPMDDETLRRKIAKQIVKARVPGYKRTNGELNDEVDLLPDVYVDNIISLFQEQKAASERLAEQKLANQLLEDYQYMQTHDRVLDDKGMYGYKCAVDDAFKIAALQKPEERTDV